MKRSAYILALAVIIILALILLLRSPQPEGPAAAPPEEERQPVLALAEKTAVTIYYLDPSGQLLAPISLSVRATTEAAQVALELLLAGPPDDRVSDSVPTDTKLLSLYSIYHTVYVDLSREFLDIPAAGMQLAVDAICATVLPLSSGDRLQILVEGQGCPEAAGVALDEPLGLPLINPEPGELTAEQQAQAEALYYLLPDYENGLLIPYNRLLAADAGRSDDQRAALIAELILPDGLRLNSAAIVDGTALLDLSLDPELAYSIGAAWEGLWLEGLTRSLCRLDSVAELELSLDGQPAAALPKGTELRQPLTPDQPVNLLRDVETEK